MRETTSFLIISVSSFTTDSSHTKLSLSATSHPLDLKTSWNVVFDSLVLVDNGKSLMTYCSLFLAAINYYYSSPISTWITSTPSVLYFSFHSLWNEVHSLHLTHSIPLGSSNVLRSIIEEVEGFVIPPERFIRIHISNINVEATFIFYNVVG